MQGNKTPTRLACYFSLQNQVLAARLLCFWRFIDAKHIYA
jgi:hypothetical protein